ncbi:MAG: hypothetical protein RIB84_26335 [Sneathiellaceae bacterium]
MNDLAVTIQEAWRLLADWFAQSPLERLALSIDVVMTLGVLAAILFGYSRLLARQRQMEEAATLAQKEVVERLEKVTERLELRLSEAADKLNRDIAVIAEDAREARRIGRSLPGQLERIQAGLSAAQDELLNQSVAKYQANEAIKKALTGVRPAGGTQARQTGKTSD